MEQVISEKGDPLGGSRDEDNFQNFGCEQSRGNVEESGDFLVDLVGGSIPCLICGVDLQVDSVVKEEIDEEGQGGGGGGGGVNDEEIFQWFLKWFKVNSKRNKRKLNRVKSYHCGYSGKMLRFCVTCKVELVGILNLQRKVDQLEEEIKKGLEVVKGKMEVCEGNFIISGVYERDFSFRRIRSLIIKCGGGGEKTTKQLNCGISQVSSGHQSSRKSTRMKLPVIRFEAITTSHESYLMPVVRLSSSDKAKADVHLDVDIKPEPETTSLSDDNPISPPTSPPPSSSSQIFNKPVKKSTKKKSSSKKKTSKSNNKSAIPSPKKTPKSSYVENYQDDWEDNYFLDDNDDNLNNDNADKPLNTQEDEEGKPKRKRRKKYDSDEDFVLDDDDPPENDEDMNFQWNGKHEGHQLRYKVDPKDPSKIYLGSNIFTITSNPPQGYQEVQCSSCATILKHDKETLRRHIIRLHTFRFACSKCEFRGTSKSDLRIHFEAKHDSTPRTFPRIPCKICGKPIPNRKHGIKNHEWTHMSQLEKDEVVSSKRMEDIPKSSKKTHQCDECGKNFNAPGKLRQHKENNHQDDFEKPKELCPECGGTFKDLRGHMKYMHPGYDGKEGRRVWECTEQNCGTKFKRLNMLVKHRNAVHKKIRPFKCTLCPREFSGKTSLQNHMNGHLGIRPWKCEVGECGVAFLTKAGLQRHNRIYHEEGSRPKRKAFVRGPTVLGADFRKGDLQRKGTYYPPSALKGWAKGRVPGHLMEGEEGNRGVVEGEQGSFIEDNQNSNSIVNE